MKVLAVDPDTHTTGIVIASENEVFVAHCVEVNSDLKGINAVEAMIKALWCVMPHLIALGGGAVDQIVVEGQRVYQGRTANPQSIVWLAQVAGAALAIAQVYSTNPNASMPYPSDWKGETDKVVSQSRAYAHYRWPYTVAKGRKRKNAGYAYPNFAGAEEADAGPNGARIPSKTQWKHVGDALALALWRATTSNEDAARLLRARDAALNASLGRRGLS